MQCQEAPLSFEKAFSRLEEILEKMNSGSLSLEESIRLYEEADKLIHYCNQRLVQAEQKIEMLVKNREGELALSDKQAPILQPLPLSSSFLQN